MKAADVNRRAWPRHTWAGRHDGCEACHWTLPMKTITAREALERWPAPGAPRGRKPAAIPSPEPSRQHKANTLDGRKLAPKKSVGSKTPKSTRQN